MYTPRNPGVAVVICSMPASASRFVSMYPAGMTGRPQSSAERYMNTRGPSTFVSGFDLMNASHTVNAASQMT